MFLYNYDSQFIIFFLSHIFNYTNDIRRIINKSTYQ
jgi:hypothetical protein